MIKSALNYNEVVRFMKEFRIDLLDIFVELTIDESVNTYATIKTDFQRKGSETKSDLILIGLLIAAVGSYAMKTITDYRKTFK